MPVAAPSPGMSPRLRNPGADRTYRPEAYESDFNASIMPAGPPYPPPPPPRSPVRNLHISNQGDIDITMSSPQLGGGAASRASWHPGGGSRAGAPVSSFNGGMTTPVRRRPAPSPAALNRSINDSIRYGPSPGPMSKSIFYDAPVEQTSPIGAEEFNRRYHSSVNATGR